MPGPGAGPCLKAFSNFSEAVHERLVGLFWFSLQSWSAGCSPRAQASGHDATPQHAEAGRQNMAPGSALSIRSSRLSPNTFSRPFFVGAFPPWGECRCRCLGLAAALGPNRAAALVLCRASIFFFSLPSHPFSYNGSLASVFASCMSCGALSPIGAVFAF